MTLEQKLFETKKRNGFECPLLFHGEKNILEFLCVFEIDFKESRKILENDYIISGIEIDFKDGQNYIVDINSQNGKDKSLYQKEVVYDNIKIIEILQDQLNKDPTDRIIDNPFDMMSYFRKLRNIQKITIYFQKKSFDEKFKKDVANIFDGK